MRERMKGAKRMFAAVLATVAAGSLLASNNCLTWNDPPCATGTTGSGDCGGCGRPISVPVTDPGTHWVCVATTSGWTGCPTDTPCQFTAAGNCSFCGFYNTFNETGPKDQLVGGNNCP